MDLYAASNDTVSVRHEALRRILKRLKASGYRFITPTPATHRRVVARPDRAVARDLRDVFGWSLPFDRRLLPRDLLDDLEAADALTSTGDGLRVKIRVSSLGDDIFFHSAFPPSADDAVFFGPDTYRFAKFLEAADNVQPVRLAIEVGVGSGAGAAVVSRRFRPARLIATDINPAAIELASVNLAAAGMCADLRVSDGLTGVGESVDLIVANPPFIAGDGERTYRDGGDMHGARLSLAWALEGSRLLTPGGRVLLYTGSAIVAGRDLFREALEAALDADCYALRYEELDPDIFGGQLASEAYRDVERIAAIGLVITCRG